MNIQTLQKTFLPITKPIPRLVEITDEFMPVLLNLLRTVSREDTYLLSPAYFAMTGRKGLWIYGDSETFMMLARHPNNDDSLLLFPPVGKHPKNLIRSILAEPHRPEGELQMARLGPEDAQLRAELKQWGVSANEKEELLDWTYPVQILDTGAVCSRLGHNFRDFRKNINRAFGRNIWSEIFDVSNPDHAEIVKNVAKQWAVERDDGHFADLIEPTNSTLQLMQTGNLPMKGLLTYEGTLPVGFIIWEETDPARGFANSVAGVSVGGKGVDEFAILKMCEQLNQRGFHQVCIGGSETSGLDAFKRKMNPVKSVQLQSAHFS